MALSDYDSRSRRTQEKLVRAFFLLLDNGETPATFTVAQLVKEAEITRGTFYLHYRDKADFYHQLLGAFRRDFFRATIVQKYATPTVSYPVMNLTAAFSHVADRWRDYTKLIALSDQIFPRSVENELRQYLIEFAQKTGLATQPLAIKLQVAIDYRIAAVCGVGKRWLQTGMVYSAPYMSQLLVDTFPTAGADAAFNDFFIRH